MLSGLHAVPCAASSHLGTSVFLQRRFPASRPCLRNVQHKLKCSVSETAEVETQAPVYRPNNKERYQRALTKDEGIRLRKASHQMGKDICSLNIGRNGITRNTIVSLGDALAGNEIVKVNPSATPHSGHTILQSPTLVLCPPVHSSGQRRINRMKNLTLVVCGQTAVSKDVRCGMHDRHIWHRQHMVPGVL